MKKTLISFILVIVMIAVTTSPAHADFGDKPDYRNFDYSSVDTLNAYDSYPKKLSPEGISYVDASLLNRIDTTKSNSVADYRYGAYLRNSTERQYYALSNLNYGGALPSNVLTVYADPYVKFRVVDENGQHLVNDSGNYDASLVKKCLRTRNFDHNIYYIEFVPMKAGHGTLQIEFSTSSSDVQPHYSFWFGHPVPVVDTYSVGLLQLSILKPNTSSKFLNAIRCTWLPRQSWVKSVTVKKTSENDKAWVSSAAMQLLAPGQTSTNISKSTSTPTMTFTYDVNSSTAYSAYCEYAFRYSKMTWNKNMSGSANYVYKGDVSVTFIYGLGCD